MRLAGQSYTNPLQRAANKYLFNGKELQDDLGLNLYDYGARMYDPQIGRWHRNDPLSESYYSLGTYNFANNNPIMNVDLDGKSFWSSEYLNRYSPHWTDKQFGESEEKSEDAATAFRNLYRSKNGGTWSKGGSVSYFGDEDESTEIIKANLSLPNAGELLLRNVKKTINNVPRPYLSDILKPSDFKGSGLLEDAADVIFSSSAFIVNGNVIIGGEWVQLQIPMAVQRWKGKSADTQYFKIIPDDHRKRISIWAYADRSILTFNFRQNSSVYSDVCDYFFTNYNNTINWTYKNPYE